jgi:hypothetical protein
MGQNIVVLRGTSGSGKTTIAAGVMKVLGPHAGTFNVGPKGKLGGYVWDQPPVTVVGRYETACGGCDAMSWKGAADDLEQAVVEGVGRGHSVLLEGLMVSTWGADRLLRLAKVAPLTVLHLDTPLDVCLDAVRARRAERAALKGQEAGELNVRNTTDKWNGLITHTRNQRIKGVNVEDVDREGGLKRALALLGVSA